MLFGTSIDEDTGKENYSYITFQTGKKIILSNEEAKEFTMYVKLQAKCYEDKSHT